MNLNKIVTLALLVFLPILQINAEPIASQQIDTTNLALNDSIDSMLDFQQNYLSNAEIEHQKLMRNIFAIGFIFMLGLLVFTILIYGGKIKKISKVVTVQADVLNATKDQLIKIINIFNFIDRQVFITDSKGNIEWHNTFASNWFSEDYEKQKVSLLNKFSNENQGKVFQGINEEKIIEFADKLFDQQSNWRMVPIKNSKNEFANMVFVGTNL